MTVSKKLDRHPGWLVFGAVPFKCITLDLLFSLREIPVGVFPIDPEPNFILATMLVVVVREGRAVWLYHLQTLIKHCPKKWSSYSYRSDVFYSSGKFPILKSLWNFSHQPRGNTGAVPTIRCANYPPVVQPDSLQSHYIVMPRWSS